MSKMWEVDPETKSKLNTLQRLPGNTTCVDCDKPSPQWASPKFGTFICLDCAGIHRSLGVHISFVRSIQMDSFKVNEVKRMETGGNPAWKAFWEGHIENKGKSWSETTVEDRYKTDVGEEYKERLSAKIEDREYVPVPKMAKKSATSASAAGSRSGTPTAMGNNLARSGSPGMGPRPQKEQNEAYFAKLGNANANRAEGLPPSQGGKYAGFGSEPPMAAQGARGGGGGGGGGSEGGIPGVDDFQKDPVAALTKGFGWFTTTVGKGAKTVNEGWIQPTAQKLAEADLATQARLTAAQVAQNVQKGTKGAADQFNRFVEGEGHGEMGSGSGSGSGTSSRSVAPERKQFWDSFGSPDEQQSGGKSGGLASKPSAIGTAAMKGGGGTGATGGKEDDKWEDF